MGNSVNGLALQVQVAPPAEDEAASRHSSSGKLRRAIAASAGAAAAMQAPPQSLPEVELETAKQEPVGALVRRYAGKHPRSNTPRLALDTICDRGECDYLLHHHLFVPLLS